MGQTSPYSKIEAIQEGLDVWISFYRANPHRFAMDYLGMTWMRPFQQVLLWIILNFTYAMIIASRGMGKSQIVAAAICVRCILFPGTKVVISAGNRGQSTNVINKIIDEFMPHSRNLSYEILEYKANPAEAYIKFKNGSVVKVATARDSARSLRANWVVNDEFVQIKKTIIDSVIRKFKAGQRTPGFYEKAEYKDYPKEPNRETYISSAHYKWHYSWEKFKAFFKSMIRGESYICLGFPYQLPVSEGYYPLSQIQEELQEDDWDPVAWSMEMCSEFWGEADNAFFSYQDCDSCRVLENAAYPKDHADTIAELKLKPEPKVSGELRILAMDVAVMGGNKNDNSAYTVMRLTPYKKQYLRDVIYLETLNGAHMQDQAIRLRQLFDDFNCDYVILDCVGNGMGIYELLVRSLMDDERGVMYHPWTCMNDAKMAERCSEPDAPHVIYSMKANAQINHDIAVSMRDCMKRNKIRFLISETEAESILKKNKKYRDMPVEDQLLVKAPYMQTTLLINELVNLVYDASAGRIRVYERSGMRKDRYSSVAYANYLANELERDLYNPDDDITPEALISLVTAVDFD